MQTRKVKRHKCPPFLTLDPHCLEWLINFKKMSVNHLDIQCHCDLDLWRTDHNINRDHLLVMTNLCVKYEDFMFNGFQYDQWKPFWHKVTVPWPSDPKINRGHLLFMTNNLVKYENLMTNSLQDIQWKTFWHLSLWPQNDKGTSTSHNQSTY